MPSQESVSVLSEETSNNVSPKLIIILGAAMAVIIVAVGIVVKFRPEWLDGRAPNPNQYILTTKPIPGNAPPGTASTVAKPTPVPTPNVGPGSWACDPLGICNRYDNTTAKNSCPKTFADPNCLNQCGDKAVQCSKF